MTRTPEKILAELKAADATHWSQPSNAGALRVHDLEDEYKALTGTNAPEWPRRECPGNG